MTADTEPIVGIDLGTTNSGVAVWDAAAGRPVMLPDEHGRDLTPSLVGWDPDAGEWVVGHAAADLRGRHPRRVAASVKRVIGRDFDHPSARLARGELAVDLLPGAGAEGVRLDPGGPRPGWLPACDRPGLTAPEASAFVLRRLKGVAEAALGRPVRRAVVTVPAYFDNAQRVATIRAGELAGLEVADILNEPTAAALAYAREMPPDTRRRVLVFDLGGGTFDVSLLDAERDEFGYQFTTLMIDGDTRLGGDDVDTRLAELLQARAGVTAPDPAARDRLRQAAEAAKRALAAAPTAEAAGVVLTAADADEASADVRRRAVAITRRLVEDVAGLRWDQVGEVVLVGGQTLAPAVQRDVAALAGKPPRAGDRPQLAVALGAAAYAHWLARGREKFHENALTNVIALPLGVRLNANDFRPLVPANAPLPFTPAPLVVTTTADNQERIEVEVLQGPRGATRADECLRLGSLVMEVPPAPARGPKFAVRFQARSDATLRVEVADLARPDRAEVVEIVEGRITVRTSAGGRGAGGP